MSVTVYNFSQTPNTGDRYCSPALYFPWLKDSPSRWPWEWEYGKSIFGGGGLLHPGTDHCLLKAVQSGAPTVIWGIGLNYHGCMGQIYPKFFDDCDLVGLRELGNPWRFVPCPSCMAPEFDRAVRCDADVPLVIYEHANQSIPESVAPGAPRKTNEDGSGLNDVLSFLASGRQVITNTFHGAYWSILLGKSPILYQPFSNRFLALGDVRIAYEHNWSAVVMNSERDLFVNLTEARNINLEFADDVRRLLEL